MEIKEVSGNGIERLQITEDDKILLTVVPYYGGKISQLNLKGIEVLWPVSDEELKTSAWNMQSVLFPFPIRLADGNYEFEGRTYQFPINEKPRNNRLHGMLTNEPFKLINSESFGELVQLSLIHEYDGSKDFFPFPFSFTLIYRYSSNKLSTQFLVENTGSRRFPFGVGWHPYFQVNRLRLEDFTFDGGEAEQIEIDQRAIPTGKRMKPDHLHFDLGKTALDNPYRLLNKPYTYSLKSAGHKLTFEASAEMEYLQLFTPEGGEALAVEPMTCNVNAFQNHEGLRILEPGNQFSCQFDISSD